MRRLVISKIRKVKTPERGTKFSAGIDFFIPYDFKTDNENNQIFIQPQSDLLIPSGIIVRIPINHVLIAFNKSGIAKNKKLLVGACVIDEDYQGEIHLHVFNISNKIISITPGEKLVQFILLPVTYCKIDVKGIETLFLNETKRGNGAFGHTNNKNL